MPPRPSASPTRYRTEPGSTPDRGSETTTLNAIGLSTPDDPNTLCVPPGPGCDRRCTYLCTVKQFPVVDIDRSTDGSRVACTKSCDPSVDGVSNELTSSNTLLVSTVIDGGAASNRIAWTALPTLPARSMPRTVTSLFAPSAPAGSCAVHVVLLIVPVA